MILEQHYLSCLSQATYLVGDEESGLAAVVDPRRDVDEVLEAARRRGLTVRHVVLTHLHADFASGHLEVAARTGATIHLGARAKTEYPFRPAHDGDVIDLGRVRLTFLETPGHTPESVCVLVHDLGKDAVRPQAVLTGDTLFVGDVGRPDLLVSEGTTADELASMLYDSIHEKLLALPDATLVYPAHGAGSLCGRSLSRETVSTIGAQRVGNAALRARSKAEFVREVTVDLPETPAYFAHDVAWNRRVHPTLDDALARGARAWSLDEALAAVAAGATLLDVRPPAEFAAGHLRGAVNVPLPGRFASWVGTVLPRDAAIVLVAEPGREPEAATRLGRIGFDRVLGHVERCDVALAARPDLVRRTRRVHASDLAEALASDAPPVVVDVRTDAEWAAGHVAGAIHRPLTRYGALRDAVLEVGPGRDVVVHCQSGARSSIAVSLLERDGATRVADLVGGYASYEAACAPSFPPP